MQPALTLRDTKTHRTGCFILTFVFVPALLHATLALMIIGATVVHIFKKLHADWLWLFFSLVTFPPLYSPCCCPFPLDALRAFSLLFKSCHIHLPYTHCASPLSFHAHPLPPAPHSLISHLGHIPAHIFVSLIIRFLSLSFCSFSASCKSSNILLWASFINMLLDLNQSMTEDLPSHL